MFIIYYLSQYLGVLKTVTFLIFGTIADYAQTMGELVHFLFLDFQNL